MTLCDIDYVSDKAHENLNFQKFWQIISYFNQEVFFDIQGSTDRVFKNFAGPRPVWSNFSIRGSLVGLINLRCLWH